MNTTKLIAAVAATMTFACAAPAAAQMRNTTGTSAAYRVAEAKARATTNTNGIRDEQRLANLHAIREATDAKDAQTTARLTVSYGNNRPDKAAIAADRRYPIVAPGERRVWALPAFQMAGYHSPVYMDPYRIQPIGSVLPALLVPVAQSLLANPDARYDSLYGVRQSLRNGTKMFYTAPKYAQYWRTHGGDPTLMRLDALDRYLPGASGAARLWDRAQRPPLNVGGWNQADDYVSKAQMERDKAEAARPVTGPLGPDLGYTEIAPDVYAHSYSLGFASNPVMVIEIVNASRADYTFRPEEIALVPERTGNNTYLLQPLVPGVQHPAWRYERCLAGIPLEAEFDGTANPDKDPNVVFAKADAVLAKQMSEGDPKVAQLRAEVLRKLVSFIIQATGDPVLPERVSLAKAAAGIVYQVILGQDMFTGDQVSRNDTLKAVDMELASRSLAGTRLSKPFSLLSYIDDKGAMLNGIKDAQARLMSEEERVKMHDAAFRERLEAARKVSALILAAEAQRTQEQARIRLDAEVSKRISDCR